MKKKLAAVAKMMRHLDFCMMTTVTAKGMTTSRPMSNNGDVKYDGNSYFFTWEKSQLVKDLKKNEHVNLSFTGPKKLFISVAGKAKLIRQPGKLKSHWTKELDEWFKDGIDTKGVVMIHVAAKNIRFWQGEKEGEMDL